MINRIESYIREENEDARKYMEEAEKCRNEGHEWAAMVYEDIAEEELQHKKVLEEMHTKCTRMSDNMH